MKRTASESDAARCFSIRATTAQRLPARPGTYAVVFRVLTERSITVGRLGRLALRPGWYLYVGSAFGPGGLQARVSRHLRGDGRPRWHVDYLRAAAQPVEVWATSDPVPREHDWAAILSGLPGCDIPLRGFGASDCRCPGHLFYFRDSPRFERFAQSLRRTHPNHGTMCRERLPRVWLMADGSWRMQNRQPTTDKLKPTIDESQCKIENRQFKTGQGLH
ncbi:MAG: GIY-YIG nuclease family protein [candidate division NC10 bacterium]|nr:GIY-YIG nuclease family protein [candidate division NC10 bacterium]